MSDAILVFPHQLYADHPCLAGNGDVYLVEEPLFFTQYRFHKQKLVLHRASMRKYADALRQSRRTVHYIDCQSESSDIRILIRELAKRKLRRIHFAEVSDDWLGKRIVAACGNHGMEITEWASPNFLNSARDPEALLDRRRPYYQTSFYIRQRKQRRVLLDPAGNPEGGQWSYDQENRLKYPKGKKPPRVEPAPTDGYLKEAQEYVEKYFAGNPGDVEPFGYPTDYAGSTAWLNAFLESRFERFGAYEDAIVANEYHLHHSVLSPMLNIGLLSPKRIIDASLEAAARNRIPLNSVEGFVRQIMGWREFIRLVYVSAGGTQRTRNHWGFTRKIPESFWQGATGIEPVDSVIRKVLRTGYSHHIERLMVVGNFMLLCEFHPDEVYRWFMEMYVDAYDWVMVPNVYGMSQFADGGMMTTKPYLSGSHYLLKMSDYPKGHWTETWDGLFWRFIGKRRDFFMGNPRSRVLVKMFDEMPMEKKERLLRRAEDYLSQWVP